MTILCGSRALADYQKKQQSVTEVSVALSAKIYSRNSTCYTSSLHILLQKGFLLSFFHTDSILLSYNYILYNCRTHIIVQTLHQTFPAQY